MRMAKDITETNVVQSLRDGDIYAFDYLFEHYSKVLYHFSYNILKSKDEAEEVVQNVFMKIWEKREKIDPKQTFRSYLFTIALNDIRKRFLDKAKEDKFKVELYDVLIDRSKEEHAENQFSFYLKFLDNQIDKLPDKRKEIFLLHKKEGLTVTEVATFLMLSPKTVENQLTAAIKTIRNAFYKKNIRSLYLFFIRLLNYDKQGKKNLQFKL